MAVITWLGTTNNNWSTGTNWDSGSPPGVNDTAVFDGAVSNVSCSLALTQSVASLITRNGYSGAITTASVNVTGNIDIGSGIGVCTTSIVMTGTSDATISMNTTNWTGSISFNKTSGKSIMLTSISCSGIGITGILNTGGFNVSVSGVINFYNGSTVYMSGSEIFNKIPIIGATNTVIVFGNNSGATVTLPNWSYANLTINDTNVNRNTYKFSESHTTIKTFILSGGTIDHSTGDYALTSTSYTQTDGTFIGGTTALNFGPFVVNAGLTFTSTSGTLTVFSFTVQAGATFNHNNGTVAINGNTTVRQNGNTFNNLSFTSSNNDCGMSEDLIIHGNLYLSCNSLSGAYSIFIYKDVIIGPGNNQMTSARFTLCGSTLQTVSSSGLVALNTRFIINQQAGGSVVISATLAIGYVWTLTNCPGGCTFTAPSVTISAGTLYWEMPGVTLPNVTISTSGDLWLTSDMIINGNLTINGVNSINTSASKKIYLNGNLTVNNTTGGSIPVTMSLNGNNNTQNISFGSLSAFLPTNVSIDHTGTGGVQVTSACRFNGIVTMNTGTLNLGTQNVEFAGNFVQVGSDLLTSTTGTCTFSWDATLLNFAHNNGRVTFNGRYNQTNTYRVNGITFNNIEITTNYNCWQYFNSGTFTVLGNLYMNASQSPGTYTKLTSGIVNLYGDYVMLSNIVNFSGGGGSALGTYGTDGFTVVFCGTTDQNWNPNGFTGYFAHVNINKPSGTLNFLGNINTYGSLIYTTGTVNPGTSVINFQTLYGTSVTITPPPQFNDVVFTPNGVSTYTITGNINCVNCSFSNQSYSGGVLSGSVINVTGNLTMLSDIFQPSRIHTTTITMNGTGTQTITGRTTYNPSVNASVFPVITVNKASGVLNLVNNVVCFGWIFSAGTLNAGSSTLVLHMYFNTPITFTTAGTESYYNLSLLVNSNNITVTGTATVLNNLVIGPWSYPGKINSGTIQFAGNLNIIGVSGGIVGTLNGGTTQLIANGTGKQYVTQVTGSVPPGNFTVNKLLGEVELASNFTISNTGQQLIIQSGVFYTEGYNVTVDSAITVASGAKLALHGSETINLTPTFSSGANVEYRGPAIPGNVFVKSWNYTFANLIFKPEAAPRIYSLSSSIACKSVSIITGTFDANGYSITVSGDWINSGTFTPGSGTVTFSNDASHNITGHNVFYNLVFYPVTAQDLVIQAGTTQIISNSCLFQGVSNINLLTIKSNTPGSVFNILCENNYVFNNVRVRDAYNIGASL